MAPPIIYKKFENLKNKLLTIDKLDVDGKEIGRDYTLAFQFEPLDLDSNIPVVPAHILKKWIATREKHVPLVLIGPTNNEYAAPNKHPTKIRKPIVKIRPKGVNSAQKLDAKKVKSYPQPSTSFTSLEQTSYTTASSEIHDNQRCDDSLENNPPGSPALSETSSRDTQSSNIIDPVVTQSSVQDERKSTQSSDFIAPISKQPPSDNSNESDAICRGRIDQLVVNEPIDDEYRFDDDEPELDTQLQKTLKKIRTDPLPNSEQSSTTTSNSITKKKETFRQPQQPPPTSSATSHNGPSYYSYHPTSSPKPVDSPKPQPPPKPKEPDWVETAKLLQLNRFDNVYKDLNYFKSHINSDNKAKGLLPEAVIKCIQEDETNQLMNMLSLMYSLDFYNDDNQFWSELILRLKRKIQPNFTLYKVKTCPDTVRANYRCVIDSVHKYASSTNLKLCLSYNDMKFFVTSQYKVQAPKVHNPDPILDGRVVEQVNATILSPIASSSSDVTQQYAATSSSARDATSHTSTHISDNSTVIGTKIEPKRETLLRPTLQRTMVAAAALDIKPDSKPELRRQDRQENVDPAVERKVTLVKDAEGKPSFRIVRPIKANVRPRLLRRKF